MPAQPRESRRPSQSSQPTSPRSERREKAKSSQSYVGVQTRRNSQQPERIPLSNRAYSASHVPRAKKSQELGQGKAIRDVQGGTLVSGLRSPTGSGTTAPPGPTIPAESDDVEVSKDYAWRLTCFLVQDADCCAQSDNEERSLEVNIAVLGNDGVGKSTFIQRSLDRSPAGNETTPGRVISLEGRSFHVKMVKVGVDDVEVDDNGTLNWPDPIQNIPIHAVMTLYDVGDKRSFQDLPEILGRSAPVWTTLRQLTDDRRCD